MYESRPPLLYALGDNGCIGVTRGVTLCLGFGLVACRDFRVVKGALFIGRRSMCTDGDSGI